MSGMFEKAGPLARGSTLSDQAAEALRARITGAVWPVGAALPSETALCAELDVSRGVIREAVSRLKAEGLLASRPGRGAYVASDRPRAGFAIGEDDVGSMRSLGQVLELRLGVEIEAAGIAARRRGPEDVTALHAAAAAFAKHQRHRPEEAREGVEADLGFHRAVCAATGNPYYLGLFNYLSASLKETIEAGRWRALERGGDSREAAEEHRIIAEAIEAQDEGEARRAMRLHLELSRDRLLGQLWDKAAQ